MRRGQLSPLIAGALFAAVAAAACGQVVVAGDRPASEGATAAEDAPVSRDAVQSAEVRGTQPTRAAVAETTQARPGGSRVVGATPDPRAGGDAGATSVRQGYLQWRAQRLPGRSCDPDGPVYLVLGSEARAASESYSDRTELLVHFGAGAKPDEIRIERSTGDEDLDARVAQAVCDRLHVRNVDETLPAETGWAQLTIHLSERGSRSE